VDKVQEVVSKVYADKAIKAYIAEIVNATRYPAKYISEELAGYIRIGASPRATIAFLEISKAVALMNGRTYVIPEDIKDMSHQILRHRIGLNYAAIADGVEVEKIIDAIVSSVKTP
jgi:MoxR-like ATPase